MVNETTSRSLRDVVADKVNAKWNEWAAAHPQLARVVDRTRLIESTVVQLRQEPAFEERDVKVIFASLEYEGSTEKFVFELIEDVI